MNALSQLEAVTVQITAQDFIVYFTIVPLSAALLVAYRRYGKRFRRIRWALPRGNTWRELRNSVRTMIIFSVTIVLLTVLLQALLPGIYRWQRSLPFMQQASLWVTLVSLPPLLLVQDIYFYWTHRFLHWGPMFRFHREHHRSHNPSVWASYSFSAVEAVIQGAFIVIYSLVVPTRIETALVFSVIALVFNVSGHCGVEFWPRWIVSDRRHGWFTGNTHHDLHHATSRSNYGLYLRLWDRLMGTEEPNFVPIYEYVASPQNDGRAYEHLLYKSIRRATVSSGATT